MVCTEEFPQCCGFNLFFDFWIEYGEIRRSYDRALQVAAARDFKKRVSNPEINSIAILTEAQADVLGFILEEADWSVYATCHNPNSGNTLLVFMYLHQPANKIPDRQFPTPEWYTETEKQPAPVKKKRKSAPTWSSSSNSVSNDGPPIAPRWVTNFGGQRVLR